VFLQLLPLILGAMLAPLWIMLVLLLLASPRGVAKGAAFVGGLTLTRLAQGAVFGVMLSASPDARADSSGQSPFASTLLLLVGILLLASAVVKWRKDADPDDPPPSWLESIDKTSPARALGLGALLMAVGPKCWVFTLSAVGVIVEEEIGLAGSIVTFVAFVGLAHLALIVAVLVCAIAPQTSSAALGRATDWLARYNRPISITVATLFGVFFFWQGASGLLG
jgi:hypothetical protein